MITAKVLGVLPLTYDRPRYRAGGPRGSFLCNPDWTGALPLTYGRPRFRAGGPRGSFLCNPDWRAENLLPFGQTPAQYRTSRYKPDPPRVRAARRPRGDGLPDIRTPEEIEADISRRHAATAAASRRLSQMRQYQRPARQYRSSLRDFYRLNEQIRAQRHAEYLAREAYKREVAARVQAAKAAGRARAAPREAVTPVAPPMVMPSRTTLSARLTPEQLTAETERILLEPPPVMAAERRERLENIRRRLGI